ncbi:hypothetical protein SUGI_0952240 [Cryptomeria japonica]|nr:hypothetical protein SUGI_0952240 [Cryptomeria japonica]
MARTAACKVDGPQISLSWGALHLFGKEPALCSGITRGREWGRTRLSMSCGAKALKPCRSFGGATLPCLHSRSSPCFTTDAQLPMPQPGGKPPCPAGTLAHGATGSDIAVPF